MEQVSFEVGEPFPMSLPRGQEGFFPLLSDETIVVPVVLSQVREPDLRTFERRPLQVGFKSIEDVPFVLLYWKKWGCLDGSLNPYQYEDKYRQRFIEGDGNALQLAVVEGRKNIIRHNRLLGLSDDMYPYLREAYADCLNRYDDEAEVNRAVGRVYQNFETPDSIMQIADKTQVFR